MDWLLGRQVPASLARHLLGCVSFRGRRLGWRPVSLAVDAPVCAQCSASAAVLVAESVVHDVMIRRASPGVIERPHWLCAACLPEALSSGRWCAWGHPSPQPDPRNAGILAAHADADLDPWPELCGLLAATPHGMSLTVAFQHAQLSPWRLAVNFGEEPERTCTEEPFESPGDLVYALQIMLEAVTALDTRAGKSVPPPRFW